MEAALGTARARGADVHVIQVVPHRAAHVNDRADPWPFEPHDNRSVAIGARLASMPHRRIVMVCVFDASRYEASPHTSFRRGPSSTTPQYLWSSAIMAAHGSGEPAT